MNLILSSRFLAIAAVVCLVLCSPGCKKSGPQGAKFNESNIKRVRTAYNIFTRLHQFKGPKSEAEFKEFFRSDLTGQVRLKRIGIELDDLDGIFVSERDGQPFKIRYELKGDRDHAVVFEDTGVDGLRQVALWEVKEVGEDEYEKYWTGKIKPAVENLDADD